MYNDALSHQFVCRLPVGFFPQQIVDKYDPLVRQVPIPSQTTVDFCNFFLQGVRLPQGSMATASQTRSLGKTQEWRSGTVPEDLFDKEVTLRFKASAGYLNYWILFEVWAAYVSFENREEYLPDLTVQILGPRQVVMCQITFSELLYTSITGIELDVTQNVPQTSTFEVTFRANRLQYSFPNGLTL